MLRNTKIYLVGTFISKAFDKRCVEGLVDGSGFIFWCKDFRFDFVDGLLAFVSFAIFLESTSAAISLGRQDVWIVMRECCLNILGKDTDWTPINYFVDAEEETWFVNFKTKLILKYFFNPYWKKRFLENSSTVSFEISVFESWHSPIFGKLTHLW